MDIITVEKLKSPARHYLVRLDTGIEFSVHEDTVIHFRLLKGTRISQQQYEHIVQYEQSNKAYQASLRYLSRRPHSSGEIRKKLSEQGYETQLIATLIVRLEEQGYLDDREFAQIWAQERIRNGKKGRSFVQYELNQKGLSSEHIHEAILHIEEGAELESAYSLLCKKLPFIKGDSLIRKRKLVQFLQRRGFTHTTIRQAFQKWNEEHGESLL